MLFENTTTNAHFVVLNIIGAFWEWYSYPNPQKVRSITALVFTNNFPLGYFIGASRSNKAKGGARMCLISKEGLLLRIWMGCGPSSNTRKTLLALWGVLYVAKKTVSPICRSWGIRR